MSDAFRGRQGQEFARRALDAMSDLDITPSPENYAVWATHIAGESPSLSKVIQKHQNAGRPVDDSFCGALYAKYLMRQVTSDEMLETSAAVEAQLRETQSVLQTAGEQAEAYGDTLQDASGALSESADASTLSRLVNELREQTQQQIERNRALESRLDESSKTVSDLRTVLEKTQKEAETAKQQAVTDALTGLSNRLRFDSALSEGVTAAKRDKKPYAVMLVDIDHFKRFNDTWGHQTGDQIIRFVAKTIQTIAGKGNVVARYGGEEFAVLAPSARTAEAAFLAEKVRAAVEAKQLMRRSTNESLGSVTVSIGVAELEGDETPDALVGRADRRLYASKHNGRNQVTSAGEGEERKQPKNAA